MTESNTSELTKDALRYLILTGQYFEAEAEVYRRKLTVLEARKIGLSVSEEELQKAADAFRLVNGLFKSEDTYVWLNTVGVSIEGFIRYLEENILIDKFKERILGKADTKVLLSTRPLREDVREFVFRNWLANQLF